MPVPPLSDAVGPGPRTRPRAAVDSTLSKVWNHRCSQRRTPAQTAGTGVQPVDPGHDAGPTVFGAIPDRGSHVSSASLGGPRRPLWPRIGGRLDNSTLSKVWNQRPEAPRGPGWLRDMPPAGRHRSPQDQCPAQTPGQAVQPVDPGHDARPTVFGAIPDRGSHVSSASLGGPRRPLWPRIGGRLDNSTLSKVWNQRPEAPRGPGWLRDMPPAGRHRSPQDQCPAQTPGQAVQPVDPGHDAAATVVDGAPG